VRLRELERRCADLALESAAQMSLADTEIAGKLRDRMAVERAGGDAVGRITRQARYRINECESGGELGPASQARAEPVTLRRRGRAEEPAMVTVRHSSRADRPAVDARRDDSDEEDSVEPRVARIKRATEHIGLGSEGRDYRRGHGTKLVPGICVCLAEFGR